MLCLCLKRGMTVVAPSFSLKHITQSVCSKKARAHKFIYMQSDTTMFSSKRKRKVIGVVSGCHIFFSFGGDGGCVQGVRTAKKNSLLRKTEQGRISNKPCRIFFFFLEISFKKGESQKVLYRITYRQTYAHTHTSDCVYIKYPSLSSWLKVEELLYSSRKKQRWFSLLLVASSKNCQEKSEKIDFFSFVKRHSWCIQWVHGATTPF